MDSSCICTDKRVDQETKFYNDIFTVYTISFTKAQEEYYKSHLMHAQNLKVTN